MINAFYSGALGMQAHQTALDVTGNNLANSDTTGFKAKQAEFKDLVYTSLKTMGADSGSNKLSTGNGARVGSVTQDLSDGNAMSTGIATDFCISGSGFFAVKDAVGNTFYTRDGAFTAVVANGKSYLADASGNLVLDKNGKSITLTDGMPDAAPGLFTFGDSEGLTSVGNNLYAATAASGRATAATEASLKQGYLESSNVDLATQMTGLITSQRGYQLSSRVVQTADQIEAWANDLK